MPNVCPVVPENSVRAESRGEAEGAPANQRIERWALFGRTARSTFAIPKFVLYSAGPLDENLYASNRSRSALFASNVSLTRTDIVADPRSVSEKSGPQMQGQ